MLGYREKKQLKKTHKQKKKIMQTYSETYSANITGMPNNLRRRDLFQGVFFPQTTKKFERIS